MIPNRPPLRVAIFTETFLPKIDGIVRILCITLENLRRIGAEVILFAPGEHVESYEGYPIVSISGVSFPFYPELTVSIPGNKTKQQLIDFKPDIVHVLHPTFTGTRGIHFAQELGVPIVASFHTNVMEGAEYYGMGFLKEPLWQIHRLIYKPADIVMATSRHTVSELEKNGFGDVQLWRRGVDVNRFSPAYATDEMRYRLSGGNPEKTIIMYIGRLAAEKQIDQLVHILDNVPNTHLALVGDGPYRPNLEEIFAGRYVTFMGYMDGDDLSTAYASGDIFVFSSSMFETFGLVVAEAMASGLSVVASRVGGVPELITQGENGLMFEVDNTEQMVEHVQTLVNNPDMRQIFGQRARETVMPLSWEAIMDELFDVYYSLMPEPELAIP